MRGWRGEWTTPARASESATDASRSEQQYSFTAYVNLLNGDKIKWSSKLLTQFFILENSVTHTTTHDLVVSNRISYRQAGPKEDFKPWGVEDWATQARGTG